MKYFRINYKKDHEVENANGVEHHDVRYTHYMAAESRDVAIEELKLDESEGGTPVEELVVTEITIDEYIEQKKQQLLRYTYDSFLQRKYNVNNMPIRKYVVFRKEKEEDKESLLKSLEETISVFNLLRLAQKKFDFSKITIADFQTFLQNALDAIDCDSFEKIVNEMPHRPE